LKTGVHSVDREFESRPLRQIYRKTLPGMSGRQTTPSKRRAAVIV
jgi:hypothetical protein